jgi:hypothetical protein
MAGQIGVMAGLRQLNTVNADLSTGSIDLWEPMLRCVVVGRLL